MEAAMSGILINWQMFSKLCTRNNQDIENIAK